MIEWRDVVGFEGLYRVSNNGEVVSLPKRGYKKGTMKLSVSHYGYHVLNLRKDGKSFCKKVHRLVAEAFIPNPNGYEVVNHIDGDKTNNNVSNLEWCTQGHNARHAIEIGLFDYRPMLEASHKSHRKKVIRDDGAVFDSINDAARSIGVNPHRVTDCIHGRCKKAGGHSFRLLDERSAA